MGYDPKWERVTDKAVDFATECRDAGITPDDAIKILQEAWHESIAKETRMTNYYFEQTKRKT